MIRTLHYDISELRPFISWVYFWHAWGMNGHHGEERDRLQADADAMLDSWQGRYRTKAVVGLFEANSDGDDIVIGDVRLPMLRQQKAVRGAGAKPASGRPQQAPEAEAAAPSLCLADFLRPLSSGIADRIGAFAATIDPKMEQGYGDDLYRRMLAETLAERLAEATAERLHLDVRRRWWGYAKDEQLSMSDILAGRYQGIRPAVGYPSMPDMSINFLLSRLLNFAQIGIRLTESGMMVPHASVSGLIFAHPQARYFDIGKIGDDQLADYARRRGLPLPIVRRFLASSLLKRR